MSTIINATTTNGVVIQPDNSGSLVLQTNNGTTALTIDTSQNVTLAGTLAMSSSFLRNRIINGDMRIDQRVAGTVTLDTNSRFIVDRFFAEDDSDATVTAVQSTTAPTDFVNSMLFTVTTADSSIAAGQNCTIRHFIEGLNVADLGWGTANAKTITLSFWVRSSVTGTYSGSLSNSAGNRGYIFNYSISTANTWEQKSVTIAGDTTGTWLTTNGVGIRIYWNLGAGSNFLGTAGAWGSSLLLGSTGSVQLISTLNATFYITGVQLEIGTSATPFERRLYNQELANCQRYFEISGANQTVAMAASSRFPAYFSVTKRTAPTMVYTFAAGTNTVTIESPTVSGFRFFTTGSVATPCEFTWTASAEL